jgi:hypothetical protein
VGFVVAKLVFIPLAMAQHQPTNWTVFCIVDNRNNPFSVKIQPDATVGVLKKAIKLEKLPEFDNIDADRLTLFKVDVPALDLGKASEQIDGFDLASMKMNPVLKLSKYYSDTPSEETIHILVQTPNTRK